MASTQCSIGDFLAEIENVKQGLQRKGISLADEIWFRGHSNPGFELLPTLLRLTRQLKLEGDEIRVFESELFFEFQAKGLSLMGTGLTDWDQLFIMRHHKLPTRLLDWTESFAVALFFAMQSTPKDPAEAKFEPVIKLLNPYALNARLPFREKSRPDDIDLFSPKYLGWEEFPDADPRRQPTGQYWDYGEMLLDENGVDWETPVALYPIRNSPRVRAQHGWFTIHGTETRPIEKIAPEAVGSVTIKRKYWPAVRAYLESTGIDLFQIYADLDSLAGSIADHSFQLWSQRKR